MYESLKEFTRQIWIITHLSLISGLISVHYPAQSSQLKRFSSRNGSCHLQARSVLQSTNCVPTGINRSGFSTELVCSGAAPGLWAEVFPRVLSQINLSLILPGCPACRASLVFCQWIIPGAALQEHRRRIILCCRQLLGLGYLCSRSPQGAVFETVYELILGKTSIYGQFSGD